MLRKLGMNVIIGANGSDHGPPHGQPGTGGDAHEVRDPDGTVHSFRRRNGAGLNDSNLDIPVNVLSYEVVQAARTTFTSRKSLRATLQAGLIAPNPEGWNDLMRGLTYGTLARPPPEGLLFTRLL